MELKNKLMLITGASSGIGAATAKAAARAGMRVVLAARTQTNLEKIAAEIRQHGGQAYVCALDVTDPQAVQKMAEGITVELGTPDVLFNNAGAGRWLFTEETGNDEAARMIAAPYLSAFYVTHAFLPAMIERNSGTIVNMTSIAAFMSFPGATAYTAARWAMRGFNEGLRADLHGTQVRTMLVAFAKVQSEFWKNNHGSEGKIPGAQALIPPLTSAQAADTILFGLQWNLRIAAAPFMLWVVLALNYLFPQITRWLLYSTGARRRIKPSQA
jgi:uncharacterized protein